MIFEQVLLVSISCKAEGSLQLFDRKFGNVEEVFEIVEELPKVNEILEVFAAKQDPLEGWWLLKACYPMELWHHGYQFVIDRVLYRILLDKLRVVTTEHFELGLHHLLESQTLNIHGSVKTQFAVTLLKLELGLNANDFRHFFLLLDELGFDHLLLFCVLPFLFFFQSYFFFLSLYLLLLCDSSLFFSFFLISNLLLLTSILSSLLFLDSALLLGFLSLESSLLFSLLLL